MLKRASALLELLPVVALLFSAHPTLAQGTATGSIQGRVINVTNGQYLNQAKIAIAGAAMEAFTESDGSYVLSRVPIGDLTLVAFYTGLEPATASVRVEQDKVAKADFSLSRVRPGGPEGPVSMSEFVVKETQEFNAQAIAINEQRFARNIRSIVTSEEHGDIGEANVAEIVKFIPGMSVNYSGGIVATTVTLRGLPSSTTSLTMDGGQVSSAGITATQRDFDLSTFQAANAVARIEVVKTPTPDLPASMLGGTINIVSRSAFERARPQLSYRAYATLNNQVDPGRFASPHGADTTSRTVRPAFDFSYVHPVNRNFGFTVNGAYNSRFHVTGTAEGAWDLVNNILPTFETYYGPQLRDAASGGITVDWKFGGTNTLSASLTNANSHVLADRYTIIGAVGAAPSGGPTFTQSQPTRGTSETAGQVDDRHDQSWQANLRFQHLGPVWKIKSRLNYSASTNALRYTDKRTFSRVAGSLTGLTLRFNDIGRRGPASMSATDATGRTIDVGDAAQYRLVNATDARRSAFAEMIGGKISAARDFDVVIPVRLEAGVEGSQDSRDTRGRPKSWTFLGPDRVANTADNQVGLYDFFAHKFSGQGTITGVGRGRFLSPYKVYQHYLAHPDQFLLNDVAAISGSATASTSIRETVSAAFLRFDTSLVGNRMKIVGGARYEHTEDDGTGVLNDLRATFVRNASGGLVLDAQGRPIPVTTDPIARARLQFTERGAQARRTYGNYHPSLNISFDITQQLIARFAYARTIGRPQYSTIIPGITVSDPTSASRIIRVNNTGLKPWTADAFDLSLEAYFKANGVASVGVFRKDITNFFGAVTRPATSELLNEVGLTDDYLNYDFITSLNVGDAKVNGLELNYRQALEFLPRWAKGVQVFANGTFLDLDAASGSADFSNFVNKTITWGLSLTRSRFSVKVNWAYSSDIRGALIAPSAAVPANSYIWVPERTTFDLSFNVNLLKHLSLFAVARNLTEAPVYRERKGPNTPDYARTNRYSAVGAMLSLGVKGEF